MAGIKGNGAQIKRLERAAEVLQREIVEQPFLPEEVKTGLVFSIDYLNKRCGALTVAEASTDDAPMVSKKEEVNNEEID